MPQSLKQVLQQARYEFDSRIAEVLLERRDLSYDDIAAQFTVSRDVVLSVVKRFNLHRRRGRKPSQQKTMTGRISEDKHEST